MEVYVDQPYTLRQQQLIAVSSFCIVISTIAVGLRLAARHQFRIKLWWDDYMCIVALVGMKLVRVTRVKLTSTQVVSYSPIITALIGKHFVIIFYRQGLLIHR